MDKRRYSLYVVLLLLLAAGLAGCGGEEAGEAAGGAEAGQRLYVASCSGCHGPEGEGVRGLGNDLTASTFVAEHGDEELIEFIKEGRGVNDPENSTGIAMPPKGGNPSLTDEDLADIVAYLRTIHE